MKFFCLYLNLFLLPCFGFSQNPIIPAKEGMTDPHIRVYDGVAYMTVCHDRSIDNTWFDINHWAMYSSEDLVNWKLEYALHPEETYIGTSYR